MLAPRMAAISVVSTAAFVGLAAIARGPEAFWAEPPLRALTGATGVTVIVALFSDVGMRTGEREDRQNRWVVPALSALGLLAAFVPALSERFGFLVFGGEGVRWLGVATYVVGGVLRLAPVFALGRRFSGLVAIQPNHQLVTSGVYGRIRHPSYLGLLLIMTGWALAFGSVLGLALSALAVVVVIARIKSEETLLADHFGADYDAYRRRTARLIPGLW